MSAIPFVGLGIALGFLCVFIERRWPSLAAWWYGAWMILNVVYSALLFAEHRWVSALVEGIVAVVYGIFWWQWRKRKKRRRALAMMGAKSQALIVKLVTRQREATVPVRCQST